MRRHGEKGKMQDYNSTIEGISHVHTSTVTRNGVNGNRACSSFVNDRHIASKVGSSPSAVPGRLSNHAAALGGMSMNSFRPDRMHRMAWVFAEGGDR